MGIGTVAIVISLVALGATVFIARRLDWSIDAPMWKQMVVTIGGGLFVLFCLIFGVSTVVSDVSCDRLETRMGRSTEWKLFGDCFVENNRGEMVPLDRWLNVEDGE